MIKVALAFGIIGSLFMAVFNMSASFGVFFNKILLAFVAFFCTGYILSLLFMMLFFGIRRGAGQRSVKK